MSLFDFYGTIGSFYICPTHSYEYVQDKIGSDKEDKNDLRKGKSISFFLKRLFE